MNRAVRIADLAVHGWVPVRDSERSLRRFTGIYQEALDVGFGHSPSRAGQQIVCLQFGGNPIQMWREIPWDEITDEVLDLIDKRLAEV